jgi:hypothetical protein
MRLYYPAQLDASSDTDVSEVHATWKTLPKWWKEPTAESHQQ